MLGVEETVTNDTSQHYPYKDWYTKKWLGLRTPDYATNGKSSDLSSDRPNIGSVQVHLYWILEAEETVTNDKSLHYA